MINKPQLNIGYEITHYNIFTFIFIQNEYTSAYGII